MPRLWYPERFHVQVICHKLAERFFATDEYPLPAFAFLDGEKGQGLLDSALALPRQSFAGRYFYRTWDEKAGVLLRSLIKNHPLVDGNKRVGLATIMVFLLMNERFLLASNEELVQFAIAIAEEKNPSWRRIACWIKERGLPIITVRRTIARLKKSDPARSAELDAADRALTQWAKWAEEYRQSEARLWRECSRLGIETDIVLEIFAEEVSWP